MFESPHPIRYISHRGFQPMAPANSLPSFAYAGLLGQWAIETDVRMTRDGMLVCCHDCCVDTTYDGNGQIAEMRWDELKKLRLNQGNRLACLTDEERRMPLFSEYLAICRQFGSVPFIELKTADAEPVLRAIREAGFTEDGVVMSSCNLDWLKEMRRLAPGMFIHWIFGTEDQLDELAALGNAGLSWRVDNCFECPPEKITVAHERGLKVCLRAGDSVESVRHMLSLGLDYIPTNCMHLPLSHNGGTNK